MRSVDGFHGYNNCSHNQDMSFVLSNHLELRMIAGQIYVINRVTMNA